MKTTLGDIATLQTGLFAKTAATGDIVYLQAKHFDEEGHLKYTLNPDLKATPSNEKHLLCAGDVLFAAKGSKNFAAVYEIHDKPCVASTSFFVIRLHDNAVLPEYLAWFLNHPETQKVLKSQAIGTSMVSISKAVLDTLEIFVPDLITQQAIFRISTLRRREKELKHLLESLCEQLIQQQLLNLITEKTQL